MKEIQVAYAEDEEYWPSFDTKKLHYIDDFHNKIYGRKIIEQIGYICFVSGKGIYLELEDRPLEAYVFEYPGPDVLEYLCEMKLFGPTSNAKMWFCGFKYAIDNEDCIAFWHKY